MKKQKTDDGNADPELMTDAEMKGCAPAPEARPHPPPEASGGYFWTAMRSLVREENNEVKATVISLHTKINAVRSELAGRLDEEAMAPQDQQNHADASLKSLNERLGRLELRPAETTATTTGPTTGTTVGPQLSSSSEVGHREQTGRLSSARATSGGARSRRTFGTHARDPLRPGSTAP